MNRKKPNLIVVAGPTASGKTAYAINLAKKLNGEIVNADSRQIYKFMDIGTNKGSIRKAGNLDKLLIDDREIVPYELENSEVLGWLFDIVTPDEEFSVSDYQKLAREIIDNINSRGKVALLVGGTGLYIDAVVRNYQISTEPNTKLREELQKLTTGELQDIVNRENPQLFVNLNNSEKNNPRRLVRMIEKSRSETIDLSQSVGEELEHEYVYIDLPKEELYDKINKRAEEMFTQGFVEEVKQLIEKGYQNTRPLQGIGYREIVSYLSGKLSLEECIEKTKQAHRNYAKRQITWFKKYR